MTGPITVDPTALNSAGASVGAEANSVSSAVTTLSGALSGHEAGFGHDAAALVFSRSYMNAANSLLQSAAAAVNASHRTGFGIQMSAYNYGTANAHSTVGGGEIPVTKPTEPPKYPTPSAPSVFGGGIAEPLGWSLVEAFVGDLWPDGDPAQMRATAAAWRTFGSSMSGGSGPMTAAGTTLGGFQIPDAPQMQKAANDISGGLTDINTQAQKLAGQIDSFATTVENTQNKIRDLLHQLSPSGIISTIGGIFEGDNPLDKIKQIADDIKAVLGNIKREADAMQQMFTQGMQDLDSLTDKLEKWADKEFVEAFGQEVGGALGATFNAMVDFDEGAFKFVAQTANGLEQLDPTRFLYDPEGAAKAWEGTGKALGEVALVANPLTAPLALSDPGIRKDLTTLGKSMIDYDDFKNGHPFRGLGYDTAQVATFFLPGAGEAAPAADAAGGAARVGAAEARAGGTVARDAGTAASKVGAASAAEEVAGQAGKISSNLDKVGVPEAAPGTGAAGKAPVEVPAPKPEAAPAPKPEPAPAPHTEPPAPHTAEPTEPHSSGPGSETHTTPSNSTSHEPPAGPSEHSPAAAPHEPAPVTHEPAAPVHTPGDTPHFSGPDDSAPHSPGSHVDPSDGRVYSMMDDTSHTTSFAPEQLGDNQRVLDAMADHGVSKSDMIDLINTPTDALTPAERDLVNDVRDALPHPTDDTVMQKVIPPGYFDETKGFVPSRADDYIMGNQPSFNVDQVGGSVSMADDTAHLGTPQQIHDGLRLDYTDSPYTPEDPGTHIIRFQADPDAPGSYEVPRTTDMGGNGAYDGWDDPFTGNGFTKSGDDVIPEYFAKKVTMRDGAEMWEVLDDGTQRLVAVLKDKEWIPQGN